MNDRAELLALRIIEELAGAGAVDVGKISDVLWSRLCSLAGGDPMTLSDTNKDWKRFHVS